MAYLQSKNKKANTPKEARNKLDKIDKIQYEIFFSPVDSRGEHRLRLSQPIHGELERPQRVAQEAHVLGGLPNPSRKYLGR